MDGRRDKLMYFRGRFALKKNYLHHKSLRIMVMMAIKKQLSTIVLILQHCSLCGVTDMAEEEGSFAKTHSIHNLDKSKQEL